MFTSILLSGFVGIGNIVASRQKDLLPVMKLDLTLRGCPCTDGNITSACVDFLEPDEYWKLDMPHNSLWKEDDYSFAVKVFSTSYSTLS